MDLLQQRQQDLAAPGTFRQGLLDSPLSAHRQEAEEIVAEDTAPILSLRDLLEIYHRHRFWIWGTFLVIVTLGLCVLAILPDKYATTAELLYLSAPADSTSSQAQQSAGHL